MKNKDSIFTEGRNCWKTAPTRRAAFLIDGQSYFDAFYRTIAHARHSIYLACWDIDSRTVLRPGEPEEENSRLGATLNRLASGRSGLHVYILAWDYAMLFALGREPLPLFNLGWRSHRRVHFHMDDRHPLGACHHRKMVVVDDSVAFVGGIDLTKRRWDTTEHLPDDPRRKDPLGLSYEPVHDVQMMVDGPVAQAAGQLFRKYWLRATGRKIKTKAKSDFDPWPREITPDITNAAAALSRTEPAHKGQPEVREVEQLYRDTIAHARHSVYIENQYLTSPCIADTLAERLKEPDGPEIVIIQPYRCSGWLEEGTMGAIRAKVVQKLYNADTSHRLRVYYPVTGNSSERDIHVHAKLCIIDNRMVRIGSSNLSNRSMGFDTECDLSCDSGGKTDIEQSIALLRNRLLGEHLGVSADTVARCVSREGSLIKAVESLAGNENRTLKPLHAEVPEWLAAIAPDPSLVDPETPIESEPFIRELAPAEERAGGTIDKLSVIIALAVSSGLIIMWKWMSNAGLTEMEGIVQAVSSLDQTAAAPLAVIAAFMIGGIIMMPVTVLIGATALVLEPLRAFVCALAGCLANAAVTYAVGHLLGRHFVRRLAGTKINRLSRRFSRRGILTVAIVRNIPIAAYSLVNMIAGASHIRFRDFIVGTALGMAPGIFALTLLTDRLKKTLQEPDILNIILLAGVAAAITGFLLWIKRRFS